GTMKLVIISGRSGSGKSTALHVLEDLGYYCIDNLPVGLLLELGSQSARQTDERLAKVAVSIDARNLQSGIENFPAFYQAFQNQNIETDIIFLDADSETLIKRFHATRRKHPLSSPDISLSEAINKESVLLEPISRQADLNINTSDMSLYELRDHIKLRVAGRATQEMALLFQSFGFKHGVPSDADYVFDVRCLPNPYWDPSLRVFTGLDKPVEDFLSSHSEVEEMESSIITFLDK
ncbi:RNase adapter RapZ, partial [Oleiphilus sp. HI0067]|uniref:RNase adapter RapZ n=1 Tax=Oleiphilus sp. HI0067 TaxID=1822243 RepID=UPI000AC556AC